MNKEKVNNLVNLAKNGDREAFGELFTLFKSKIYNIVYKRLGHAEETNEVMQDVFLQALSKISDVNPCKFSGWICTIAVRLSINRGKRKSREKVYDFDVSGLVEKEKPNVELLERKKEKDKKSLDEAINSLEKSDKELITDFYISRLSILEISRKYCIPDGTVKSRLYAVRDRLREKINGLQHNSKFGRPAN